MLLARLFGSKSDERGLDFLSKHVYEQRDILKKYIKNYSRKLQLIDSLPPDKELSEGNLKRMRGEFQRLMKIDFSEKRIVKKEEKSIRQIVHEVKEALKNELSTG